jgi:hypothetical protein
MITSVNIPGRFCQCEALLKDGTPCGYEWFSIAFRIPSHCQNRECRSREWNGKKERKVPEKKPQVVLPKPRKVRQVDDGDGF